MKYPEQQLKVLQDGIDQLSYWFALDGMNPSNVQYLVFQQASEGQKHNWLYRNGEQVQRLHSIEDVQGWEKLINVPATFELYPAGCNDTHIETAVKHCIKNIAK